MKNLGFVLTLFVVLTLLGAPISHGLATSSLRDLRKDTKVDAGLGDDQVTVSHSSNVMRSGPGQDEIPSGAANNFIEGGPGNEQSDTGYPSERGMLKR